MLAGAASFGARAAEQSPENNGADLSLEAGHKSPPQGLLTLARLCADWPPNDPALPNSPPGSDAFVGEEPPLRGRRSSLASAGATVGFDAGVLSSSSSGSMTSPLAESMECRPLPNVAVSGAVLRDFAEANDGVSPGGPMVGGGAMFGGTIFVFDFPDFDCHGNVQAGKCSRRLMHI